MPEQSTENIVSRQPSSAMIELGQSVVMHARLKPFVHRFVYRVFCIRVRLDQPEQLSTLNSWLFGVNRSRPVSLMFADHGNRDGGDLMAWLKKTLSTVNVSFPQGAVWLQCFPRLFGYVFNPVSFWTLYDKQGQLQVLLAEVNNTFGQRHLYVLSDEQGGCLHANSTLVCQKVFHVSPFCAVKGHYQFKLDDTALGEKIAIDYFDDASSAQPLLRTAMTTTFRGFSVWALFKQVLRMPVMTLGVMLRIHWQAFKLWRQGAKFHSTPVLPQEQITTNKGTRFEHD